jgi:hypothetical protein
MSVNMLFRRAAAACGHLSFRYTVSNGEQIESKRRPAYYPVKSGRCAVGFTVNLAEKLSVV